MSAARHSLPLFQVPEDVLVFAFRYALGRRTSAPWFMVVTLLQHWDRLEGWTQDQICREITTALLRGDGGAACDVDQWHRVLKRHGRAVDSV